MTNEFGSYKRLAERLDNLPNGFPPTEDGSELRVLQALFSAQEAELAAQLRLPYETAEQIAERLQVDSESTRQMLKSMAKRGLIRAGKTEGGLGYGLLPFVVGIYENQVGSLTKEFAQLFEAYYVQAFSQALRFQPAFHRVVPVGESIKMNMRVEPYESAAGVIESAQSWGVIDCICRVQTALIGKPCKHPVDVCMIFSPKPKAFANTTQVKELTKEGAYATLKRADEAGLVHCISNNQRGDWYICNCCTCSCGILRGMAELGIANVVASSAFVNSVDENLCNACGLCVEYCQFDALAVDQMASVNRSKCVGCGVCVSACSEEALSLVRRPEEEIKPVPVNIIDWGMQRAQDRGIDLSTLL
jgi:H+/Na+-translocating ferredoxin:NAD+ oxidoreductase subunit B